MKVGDDVIIIKQIPDTRTNVGEVYTVTEVDPENNWLFMDDEDTAWEVERKHWNCLKIQEPCHH